MLFLFCLYVVVVVVFFVSLFFLSMLCCVIVNTEFDLSNIPSVGKGSLA